MTAPRLDVLRAIDKADKLPPIGVFELLTNGRRDASGAFIPGCGISNGQAVAIVWFLGVGQETPDKARVHSRIDLLVRLEEKKTQDGYTAWDALIDMSPNEDETWRDGGRPKNIGWALDDILTFFNREATR